LIEAEEPVEFEIDGKTILPSRADIEAAMGYAPGSMPAYFSSMADDYLSRAPELMRVRCALAEASIGGTSPGEGWIEMGGRRFRTGRRAALRMSRAERAAVFACTVGPGLSALARERAEGDEGLEAYLVDAIASQAAENAAEAVQRRAEEEAARRGLGATERYSPGYCGWPVSEQALLFALLPAGACGIELTESSMMTPEKSVSGFFGLGRGLRRAAYGCGECDRHSCPSRAAAARVRG
jgi:hypothetical protein